MINFKIDFKKQCMIIKSLCIFENLKNDRVIDKYYSLLNYLTEEEIDIRKVIELYNEYISEILKFEEDRCLKSFIIDKILLDSNYFTKCIDEDKLTKDIYNSVKFEMNCLKEVYSMKLKHIKEYIIKNICKNDFEKHLIENLLEEENEHINLLEIENIDKIKSYLYNNENISDCIDDLIEYYKNNGTGIFAAYKAFVWKKENNECYLSPVIQTDDISLKQLIGYEEQKKTIIENTLQFLQGYNANNILLYGQRGTGKSSTVKAIVNEYYKDKLRLIEVDKDNLSDFSKIVEKIKNKNLKFIIFVDDLVFNEGDERYSALKTILEGKVENNCNNILIYATTNRKHLVKESFSERGDEVHAMDSIEEKLSLSDRFGITVSFYSPTQKEFLNIIDKIAEANKLDVDTEYIHKEAIKWVRYNNSMSPRCANQFMNWFIAKYENCNKN